MRKYIRNASIIALIAIFIGAFYPTAKQANAAQAPYLNKSILVLPNTTHQMSIGGTKKKPTWRSSNPKLFKITKSGKLKVPKSGMAVMYAKVKVSGITYVLPCQVYVLGKSYDKEYLNLIPKKTVSKYKKAYKTGSTKGLSKTEKKVFKKLKKALDSTKGCKTKAAKELAIHDWICANTVYRSNGTSSYNYEGLFINGEAVCQGYSEAFKLCMDILNIPCEYVAGYYIPNKKMYGNKVQLQKLSEQSISCQ